MQYDLFSQLKVSRQQVKILFGSFLSMFIMVGLQYFGVHSPFSFSYFPKIISPIANDTGVMNIIRPKIENIQNNFYLKKTIHIVPTTYASESTDYNNASSYALINFSNGTIIAEKNGSKRLPIASLTKIMSSVVALDLANPKEVFTITKSAASMPPTKIGVIPGQKMSLQELLSAGLLTSANDAMEAVKDGINNKYHKNVFVQAMNEKASFLGLTNTHFTTPQGFDYRNNYSSANDLAVLMHYALMNYPFIAKTVQKNYMFLPASKNHKQFDLYNWNGLIDVYPDTVGIKIGNTTKAGFTSAVLSQRGGETLLAIILGAPNIVKRDLWSSELLDIGYQETMGLAPVNVTTNQLYAKYATWKFWN